MKNYTLLTALLCLIFNAINAQTVSTENAKDVLNKCIKFHDPKGNWGNLHQKLYFHAKEPDNDNIREEVLLDNRVTYFCHISRADSNVIEKEISDTVIVGRINGDTAMTEENRKKYRLMPRQIRSARNSYVYLYGLPMKLTDNGTILSDTVRIDTFNSKTYLVLNVKYEKGIGNDTWFFYIHPTTYALEGYRFNHNRKPNDGEFIICEDLIEVDGIRMPKVRLWHENATKKYMATDILERTEDWIGKK
jgi:Family of unknown function (DUF6503)